MIGVLGCAHQMKRGRSGSRHPGLVWEPWGPGCAEAPPHPRVGYIMPPMPPMPAPGPGPASSLRGLSATPHSVVSMRPATLAAF